MMKKRYKHLTQNEREQIYVFLQKGLTETEIANELGRSRSTITRELNKNHNPKLGYLPDRAVQNYHARRLNKGLKIDKNPELKEYITAKLNTGWSPEIISGHLRKEKGINVISHETIYAYIYSKEGKSNELYLKLTKKRKKRKPRKENRNKQTKIPNRVSIHERPKKIEKRDECGHWEGDLMLFSNTKTNLITLRERKSRFMLAIKNPNKKSDSTTQNIIQKFRGRKNVLIETLTLDNGGEFAGHQKIAAELKINTFFCDPYSSYQKGSVENGNGVIRYSLPRSTDIDIMTQGQIDKVVNKMNNRPMKCLGFRTPAEIFKESFGCLAG